MRAVQPRPSPFFWFVAVYAAAHFAWTLALIADFVVNPWAPDAAIGLPSLRLVTGVLFIPLVFVVPGLVLRRVPGNITGLCLVLWGATLIGSLLRPESPLFPINQALNTGWSGLWLLGLYFPDSRPAQPRLARPVQILGALLVVSLVIGSVSHLSLADGNANPLLSPKLKPLQMALSIILAVGLGGSVLLILPSLVIKHRSGDDRRCQQIRWLAWTYALLLAAVIPARLAGLMAPGSTAETLMAQGLAALVTTVIVGTFMSLAPYIAVGNAILRHRLYDIDIIMRGTLVYTAVTALLALVFFGTVIVLQRLFTALTRQESAVAVVASTLVIAALFSPLRRRVQDFVDRRFYRRKYDAEQVLAQFTSVARDETDVDRLTAQPETAIDETLRPSNTSIWLARM